MKELLMNSLYFGMVISVGTYLFGVWLRKKVPLAILNPLLVSILLTIAFLLVFKIDYQDYNEGVRYLSYFLTPATVCLA
ncbi:MAG: LrgB family protein, partial [Hungatella hathewayi]